MEAFAASPALFLLFAQQLVETVQADTGTVTASSQPQYTSKELIALGIFMLVLGRLWTMARARSDVRHLESNKSGS
jgi:hypothetical protein